MRFVSFALGGFPLYGKVEGDGIVLPTRAYGTAYPSLRAAIAGGALHAFEVDPHARPVPLAGLALDPVIPDPGKILCAGRNYHAHGDDAGTPEHPPVFIRLADSQTGHNAPLLMPAETSDFELEGELAAIIARPGHRIPVETALDHVAGYCCYNDASARDWQRHSDQYTAGKNFPMTGACGPWLVTSDEVGDPNRLKIEARVNGVVHQSDTTAGMLFSTAALIAYLSCFTPLSPGDIVVTGTPARTEAGKGQDRLLKTGDVVEIDIERIGVLRNIVTRAGETPG
ncbi:MAG: fumarylacetoacetate hydrolase family protein [Alphaproteobacteria bacterium]|nr:fumarylacetoacetate hydrolase family protein [Alphaproteobacteria bacterium]